MASLTISPSLLRAPQSDASLQIDEPWLVLERREPWITRNERQTRVPLPVRLLEPVVCGPGVA